MNRMLVLTAKDSGKIGRRDSEILIQTIQPYWPTLFASPAILRYIRVIRTSGKSGFRQHAALAGSICRSSILKILESCES